MKEYIFLLRGYPNHLTLEETQQLRLQWGRLVPRWREEKKFVEGYIFSDDGHTIEGAPERLVNDKTVIEHGMQAAGFVIILAADMEEALQLAKLCPLLDFGGTVEVRERVPQPAVTTVQQTTFQ